MNMMLSGREPEFLSWRLSNETGTLTISDNSGVASAAPPGFATALAGAVGAEVPTGEPQERRIEVDQTNISVIIADRWIVKLIRTPGSADRSATIERQLADAAPGGGIAPPFLGAVTWEHPERGAATIALISEFMRGAEDGWTWAPDDVIDSLPERDPGWPEELGELTARLHLALAAADFPEVGESDLDRDMDARELRQEVETAFAVRGDPTGARIRNRLDAMQEALETAGDQGGTPGIVIHGDLHVGQVLRGPQGKYHIVDFDGDPQSGYANPWRRFPVARDVAHMLVSIDLVAAVAQKRVGQVDREYFAWADRAKHAFLDSYMQGLREGGQDTLFDPAQLPSLSAEQLLLELRYAAHYLPSWEYAPDGVISHRYRSSAHESETSWTPPALLQT